MNRRTNRRNRGRTAQGFTLIEIMVVLVIIGMMVGFGGLMVFQNLEKAKQKEAMAQTSVLYDALIAFNLDCSRFPTETEGLDALIHRPADAEGWNGPYIEKWQKIPLDPWKRPYDYMVSVAEGERETPMVISLGKGGAQGGTDLASDVMNGQIMEDTSTTGGGG